MPELPEVETVARALAQEATGFTVEKLDFLRDDLRELMPKRTLRQVLVGQTIDTVRRRGKYVVWLTSKGYVLLHLGMSGRLAHRDTADPVEKHTHVVWELCRGTQRFWLHYIDPRRFGRLDGGLGPNWEEHRFLRQLGVEPLATKNLGGVLQQRMGTKSAPLKNLLLDARHVVGIGNIYACEALFLSGLDPMSPGSACSREQFDCLAVALQKVLKEAIKAGGTTVRDFASLGDRKGYFSTNLQVYGRADETCTRCTDTVKVTKLAGRSTWFCPTCQSVAGV